MSEYEIIVLRDEDGSVNRIEADQVELQDVFGNVLGVFSDAEAQDFIKAEIEDGKIMGRSVIISGAF